MNLIPSHDRIIIRPDDPLEITSGGIYIPELAQKRSVTGNVISVGCECRCVRGGDRAAFQRYQGERWEELLIVREDQVLGVKDGEAFRPIMGQVLLRTLPQSDRHGNLYIPTGGADRLDEPRWGVVVSQDPNEEWYSHKERRWIKKTIVLEPGSSVLYPTYSGTILDFGGQEHVILLVSDVLGVIHKED